MIKIDKEAIKTTGDGSKTLFNDQVGEHYHSKHGAVSESKHVFLNAGLDYFLKTTNASEVRILEVGFGTGLNFLLTADYCIENKITLDYRGVEAYPLTGDVLASLEYGQYLNPDLWSVFLDNYNKALIGETSLTSNQKLRVLHQKILKVELEKLVDVVYFDAFAAIHQPEMWTMDVLEKVASLMNKNGVFVTYAITGQLKRGLKELGFRVEKLPGALFKREMLRAIKL